MKDLEELVKEYRASVFKGKSKSKIFKILSLHKWLYFLYQEYKGYEKNLEDLGSKLENSERRKLEMKINEITSYIYIFRYFIELNDKFLEIDFLIDKSFKKLKDVIKRIGGS